MTAILLLLLRLLQRSRKAPLGNSLPPCERDAAPRQRPDPRARNVRAARRRAAAIGLALDCAKSDDGARRNGGRFWLTDPALHKRVGQADTLPELNALLRRVEADRRSPGAGSGREGVG